MLHERGDLDSAIAEFDQAIAIESSSLSRKTSIRLLQQKCGLSCGRTSRGFH